MIESHSRMPFGRFQGVALRDIPVSYLTWIVGQRAIQQSHPRLVDNIARHLAPIFDGGLTSYLSDRRVVEMPRLRELWAQREAASCRTDENLPFHDLTEQELI